MREPDSSDILERFNSGLDLVDIVASRVARSLGTRAAPSLLELGDLVSAGREGLLDAARRYDPARGVSFRAYANYRVLGTMIVAVRRASALPRRMYERLAALEASALQNEGQAPFALTNWNAAADTGDAETILLKQLAATATASALGIVAEPLGGPIGTSEHAEKAAVDPETAFEHAELMARVRQAFDELEPHEAEVVRRHYFEGHRLGDIARDLGFGKSWASRLHTRAIAKLTARLRGAE